VRYSLHKTKKRCDVSCFDLDGMIDNLRMEFFARVICGIALIGGPFGLMEGIWSDPFLRGFVRKFDGSLWIWVFFFFYYTVLFLWWLRGFIRASKKLECSLTTRLNVEHEMEASEKSSSPER